MERNTRDVNRSGSTCPDETSGHHSPSRAKSRGRRQKNFVGEQGADRAEKLPGLFPDNSKTGGRTRASPKIWLNKKDFDAKTAAFGKAVANTRDKAKMSVAGLKATIPVIGEACDNCHKDYRVSQQ